MKKNIKAALLSGLVFPGIGQIYKGCRIKGFLIIFAVNILFMIAFALMLRDIYQQVMASDLASIPDPLLMAKRVIGETPGLNWLMGALLCIWLYGIVDALFAGSGTGAGK